MKEIFAVIVIILLVSLAISYWYIWLPILVVVVGIYIYSSSGKKKNAASTTGNFIKSKSQKVELESWKVDDIRIQAKKLAENVKIMNTSSDYDAVTAAFDAACAAFRFLSGFTDEEIRATGYSIRYSKRQKQLYLKT